MSSGDLVMGDPIWYLLYIGRKALLTTAKLTVRLRTKPGTSLTPSPNVSSLDLLATGELLRVGKGVRLVQLIKIMLIVYIWGLIRESDQI